MREIDREFKIRPHHQLVMVEIEPKMLDLTKIEHPHF